MAGLSRAVERLGRDLQAWTLLAESLLDALVVIDQAEDLRRRLRDTGIRARQLVDAERTPVAARPGHGAVRPSPVAGALVVVATSLHAASHAMSPAASAIRRQELPATLTTCGMVAARVLTTATRAAQDTAHMIDQHPGHRPGPVTQGPCLRLVHVADQDR